MNHDSKDFDLLLVTLLQAGLEITLGVDPYTDSDFTYNINTGAKSSMTIAREEGVLCRFEKRYSSGACENYQEFLQELKDCLCGRYYANNEFLEFLAEEGLIKRSSKIAYDLCQE